MTKPSQPVPVPPGVARLLDPTVQDRLPLIGVGTAAQVRRAGRYVVKIAHNSDRDRARLGDEIQAFTTLGPKGRALCWPRLRAHDPRALVRDHVPGPPLLARLPLDDARLSSIFFQALGEARTHQATLGFPLDFSPANLWWDEDHARLWLFDLGRRLDAPLFGEVQRPDQVPAALETYLAWRRQTFSAARPTRPHLPPSGRFHVEVPCGPHPDAQLLWENRTARVRHRAFLSKDQLFALTNQVTFGPRRDRTLPATRYQDAPGKGEGFAQGDGRSVLVGHALGRSLMAKGCGPTPLKWTGNPYHEDGLVSFPRTLWETSICDELLRLGFDVPEVWAIASAPGQRTVDQTDLEWPAAVALRAATSHHRLGHLLYFSDDRDAFLALVQHIADTDPHLSWLRPTERSLRRLCRVFAETLGRDTGRADALNIQCFNPTVGNVRVDGHLLDFSTVRFMDRYVTDFVYMNQNRRVREARVAHRGHVRGLVQILARVFGWSKAVTAAHLQKMLRGFDAGYTEGAAAALALYLGLDEDAVLALGRRSLRPLVDAFRQLRKPRGPDDVVFAFWDQKVREPLYEWERYAPRYLDALGQKAPRPHERLVRDGVSIPARHRAAGARFDEVWRRLLPRLPGLEPRAWSGIVRPFMECEALADRIYRRSTPARFGAWRVAMASGRALPEGRYTQKDAATLAAARGHVHLWGAGGSTPRPVVGLVPEVHERAQDVFADLLGPRLVAAYAGGPRVAGPGPVVERGPDGAHTTPMSLHVVVEPGPDPAEAAAEERMVAQRLAGLCALYAWDLTFVPLAKGSATDRRSLGSAVARALGVDDDALALFAHREGLPASPRG